MTAERTRVDKGVPTGGQFAATAKADDGNIDLSPQAHRYGALSDYEVNDEFSVPQANDLDKIVTVADAVASGAVTQDSIGEALGLHHREGGYYANAAGYLGIVEVDKSDALHTYHLTNLGESLVNTDENGRADMISQMVNSVPEVQIYQDEGEDQLRASVEAAGLSGETITRRTECIKSWAAAVDGGHLSTSISETAASSHHRFAGAAASAVTQLNEARAKRSAPEPVYNFCGTCNMTLPATGICDDCAA